MVQWSSKNKLINTNYLITYATTAFFSLPVFDHCFKIFCTLCRFYAVCHSVAKHTTSKRYGAVSICRRFHFWYVMYAQVRQKETTEETRSSSRQGFPWTNHVLITVKIRWHNELQTMDPTETTGRWSNRFIYINHNNNNHTIHVH